MPPTLPSPIVALGPGYLLWAPLLSTLPTNTVVGSVFTDAWAAAWIPLGATDSGSVFSWQLNVDQVDAAEYLDPLAWVTTGRVGSIQFELANISATNFKRMLNGGSIVVTGSTTTTLSSYTPPAAGAEVRAMIGWESLDSTERLIGYQTLNTAEVKVTRAKGASNATLPAQFNMEVPAAGGQPFGYWTAGVARA